MDISALKEKIICGYLISKDEAMELVNEELETLCRFADEIRKHFCNDSFDICTIINGKSGKCSENCKFCAQSSFYKTKVENYQLLPIEEIVEQAEYNDNLGVMRYSIVTSGRNLSDNEVNYLCQAVSQIKMRTKISVCISCGLLSENQFEKLKKSGVSRVHNNLETSKNNFKNICTTHTFEDKIMSIKNAQKVGLDVCSGGIMGLGETFEDRIDLAFSLRELNVVSVPINMLNPISGTPFENNKILTMEEMRRIVAIFRFILPNVYIRLAGGRGLLVDKGSSCLKSGANAVISGDMLTTTGTTVSSDMEMIKNLGYRTKKMSSGIFITATGTDIGKTYVSALIVKKLRENGINAGYYKAALSGADNVEVSDAGYVNSVAGINQDVNTLVSYLYKNPVSPHLAAMIEGNPVELSKISADFLKVKNNYDFVLVEGSGGIVCPIRYDENNHIFLEDIVKLLKLDTIIVADAGLGTINAVVLTHHYLTSKNINVRGIILNNFSDTEMENDNIKMIEEITKIPVIALVKPNDKEINLDINILME